jgi:hypothetical protein
VPILQRHGIITYSLVMLPSANHDSIAAVFIGYTYTISLHVVIGADSQVLDLSSRARQEHHPGYYA